MKQELRIKLDMSITVDCKHSAAGLAAMVERGVRASFPNNRKVIHSLKFAEEHAIYSQRRDRITWSPIIKPLAIPPA
jgi:hypothetical protein